MSWSTLKTEAIILSAYPNREVDRRYKAITPSYGKIEFSARGAQKILAKLAPHLDPFAILEIEIIKGRRSNTVISVEKKYIFTNVHSDLQLRLLGISAGTLLDKYTNIEDKDEAIYQMLVDWMTFLDGRGVVNDPKAVLLLGAFIIRLINRLGYEIDLRHCLSCKVELNKKECRWHSGRGGFVCEGCVQDDREWFSAREVDKEVLEAFRKIKSLGYDEIFDLSLQKRIIADLSKMIHEIAISHIPTYFERPFWSGIIRLETTAD
ncbi:DNA repair protein RecO [Patescibacteria group bacterium]|nr:DNA repair protein RecO [Patescibacteria group bacterium]